MSDASDFARTYLAYNAAESGADEVIRQLLAENDRLRKILAASFQDIEAGAAEVKRLQAALIDMCNLAAENSQYKGEYLAEKHGDAEEIAKARALAGKEEK